MAKRKVKSVEFLALRVCEAVVELTRDRAGRGQQFFVMLASVEKHLAISAEDLEKAVAYAVERGALEEAPGSIAVHRQYL